jgi:hypothetical protein
MVCIAISTLGYEVCADAVATGCNDTCKLGHETTAEIEP